MRWCRVLLWALAIALAIEQGLAAQSPQSGLSMDVRVAPAIIVPLGESAGLFATGTGAGASAVLRLGRPTWLSPTLDLGYAAVPVDAGGASA